MKIEKSKLRKSLMRYMNNVGYDVATMMHILTAISRYKPK